MLLTMLPGFLIGTLLVTLLVTLLIDTVQFSAILFRA